ncbi:hypothetical protein niasHS_008535 [Heterodera schachtii]|uniref:Ubiquitin-like domain-containing protein n=1 Tax=Heterodera schachtii TaxID=97005 RepID=A0ABD2J338_HETSC
MHYHLVFLYIVLCHFSTGYGQMQLFVKSFVPRKMIKLDVGESETVDKLKTLIHQTEGIPPDQQMLFIQLEDGRKLSDYNLQSFSTIGMVLRPSSAKENLNIREASTLGVANTCAVNPLKMPVLPSPAAVDASMRDVPTFGMPGTREANLHDTSPLGITLRSMSVGALLAQ